MKGKKLLSPNSSIYVVW